MSERPKRLHMGLNLNILNVSTQADNLRLQSKDTQISIGLQGTCLQAAQSLQQTIKAKKSTFKLVSSAIN